MKSQISLLQAISFLLPFAVLGFLIPIFDLSLNLFRAAPFWIVVPALLIARSFPDRLDHCHRLECDYCQALPKKLIKGPCQM